MDAQLVEMLGRHRLIAELLRANLEVAIPARDRGIDLIAYADLETQVTRFSACPIQLKAALGGSFSVDRKYAKFSRLADCLRLVPRRSHPDSHVCHHAP